MNIKNLPEWKTCEEKLDKNEPLSPLEQFIYNNEPSGSDDLEWRESLTKAIHCALEVVIEY